MPLNHLALKFSSQLRAPCQTALPKSTQGQESNCELGGLKNHLKRLLSKMFYSFVYWDTIYNDFPSGDRGWKHLLIQPRPRGLGLAGLPGHEPGKDGKAMPKDAQAPRPKQGCLAPALLPCGSGQVTSLAGSPPPSLGLRGSSLGPGQGNPGPQLTPTQGKGKTSQEGAGVQPSSSPACSWVPSREPGVLLHWALSDTHRSLAFRLAEVWKGKKASRVGSLKPPALEVNRELARAQTGRPLRPSQPQSTLKTTSCPCSPGTGSGRGARRPASLSLPLPGERGSGSWGARAAKVELLFRARGCRGRQGQVSLENLALSTHSLPSTLVTGGPARCPSTPSCQEHPCS